LISFRYHLVTIVAVFLGIGLGVLVGTTVLDQGLVSNLNTRLDRLERSTAVIQKQRDAAQATSDELQRFIQEATPFLISDRLGGQPVVVVTYDGTDPAPRTEARDALTQAGAKVVAVLSVTDKMAAADEASRAQLATLLGESTSAPASPAPTETTVDPLVVQAAAALGDRLAAGRKQGDLPPKSGHADILAGLIDQGFVKSPILPADLPGIGGAGQVILVVTGGSTPPPVPIEEFMLPLVEQVGQHAATWLAVGENTESSVDPLVPTVRADSSLSTDTIVTVDDLDADFGGISLVLGLEALIQDGRGGSYGVESGTDGLIPQAP
jgi:hypothetical protein